MLQRRHVITASLLVTFLCMAPSAQAKGQLKGKWVAPFAKLRFSQNGPEIQAKVISTSKECKLKKGQGVLKGVLLEDNLTGEITICQHGPGCAPTTKAFVILLASHKGRLLTGALHLPNPMCKVPGMRGKSGLRFFKGRAKRIKKHNKNAVFRGKTQTEKKAKKVNLRGRSVKSLLQEGLDLAQHGLAEDARLRFKAAAEADPSSAEAFNGVGVTYYLRQQFTDALLWYKKALEANPDFGDSFYNMACIYSLENKSELSLRYLKIAMLNGYAGNNDISQILQDPDLDNVKKLPAFTALVDEVKAMQQPAASKTPKQDANQDLTANSQGSAVSSTAAHEQPAAEAPPVPMVP